MPLLDPATGLPRTSSAVGNTYTFTGRELDSETGLMHFRARSYSAKLGRFIQRDPSGFGEGMNLYEYLRGRPKDGRDPTGLAEDWLGEGANMSVQFLAGVRDGFARQQQDLVELVDAAYEADVLLNYVAEAAQRFTGVVGEVLERKNLPADVTNYVAGIRTKLRKVDPRKILDELAGLSREDLEAFCMTEFDGGGGTAYAIGLLSAWPNASDAQKLYAAGWFVGYVGVEFFLNYVSGGNSAKAKEARREFIRLKKHAIALKRAGKAGDELRRAEYLAEVAKYQARGCFTAETLVSTTCGQKPIAEVDVGERVIVETDPLSETRPPKPPARRVGWMGALLAATMMCVIPASQDSGVADGKQPSRWVRIELSISEGLGHSTVVVLLRTAEWAAAMNAVAGNTIPLALDDLDVSGNALVRSVTPARAVVDGPGRMITAKVSHGPRRVVEVVLRGVETPLRATAVHPVFSEDRDMFVAVGELRVGERLRSLAGPVVIQSILAHPELQPVFNLEVEREHVYHVGKCGILAHNVKFRVVRPKPGTNRHVVVDVPGNHPVHHGVWHDPTVRFDPLKPTLHEAPIRGHGDWYVHERPELGKDKLDDVTRRAANYLNGRPVKYRHGFPDYKEFTCDFGKGVRGEVELPRMQIGDRLQDFHDARKELLKKLQKSDSGWTANDIIRLEDGVNIRGANPTGLKWTWHHHEDLKTMQLVPSDVHARSVHPGGVSLAARVRAAP